MGLVELPGEGEQLGLGVQGGGGVVGGAHAVLDRAAESLGQPVTNIPQLVQLAPGEHGMVEQVGYGAAERLGAIQHAQDRSADIQATLAQPSEQLAGQGGVLGGPLDQGQRVLGPVDGDAEGDHAGVLTVVDPVDHEADQVELGQVGGQQLGQRGLGHGHEPAGDRRLRGARRALLDPVPTGSRPRP
jgi:hypothetical protein